MSQPPEADQAFDPAERLLRALEELPGQVDLLVRPAEVVIRERHNNLWTQHSVGRDVVALTFPAVNKAAWISVLEPRSGSSSGGKRTRFETQEAALAASRRYAEEVAQARAEVLQQRQGDELEAAICSLIDKIGNT